MRTAVRARAALDGGKWHEIFRRVLKVAESNSMSSAVTCSERGVTASGRLGAMEDDGKSESNSNNDGSDCANICHLDAVVELTVRF